MNLLKIPPSRRESDQTTLEAATDLAQLGPRLARLALSSGFNALTGRRNAAHHIKELEAQLSERDELIERLHIDPVTGLLNREGFNEQLKKREQRFSNDHERSGDKPNITTIVLVIDLDEFKAINDQYGHPVGDRVLSEVGVVMSECLRDEDIITIESRPGGDEFVAVIDIPGSQQETAPAVVSIMGRVELALLDINFNAEGEKKIAQGSVGFVVKENCVGDTLNLAITEADAELYATKKQKKSTRS